MENNMVMSLFLREVPGRMTNYSIVHWHVANKPIFWALAVVYTNVQ